MNAGSQPAPWDVAAYLERIQAEAGDATGWDGWRIRTKQRLRVWWFRAALRGNLAVFADPALRPVLDQDLNHGQRVLRPYLIRGLKPAGRLLAVRDHFQFLLSHLSALAIHRIYVDGAVLLRRETPAGEVALKLLPPTGLGREGELRIDLQLDGRTLHMLAVAVVSPQRLGLEGTAPVLWIGCSKGPGAEEDFPELIKRVTKAMQGMRPKALILHAAQALVAAWGLAGLYGVANEGTVFAGYRDLKKRIKADYDQFWREYDGHPLTPHVYQLPLEPIARDPATLASSKRSAAARKAATARQWYDDLARAAAEMRHQ